MVSSSTSTEAVKDRKPSCSYWHHMSPGEGERDRERMTQPSPPPSLDIYISGRAACAAACCTPAGNMTLPRSTKPNTSTHQLRLEALNHAHKQMQTFPGCLVLSSGCNVHTDSPLSFYYLLFLSALVPFRLRGLIPTISTNIWRCVAFTFTFLLQISR